jgi:tetratricopeptide (TPR) repeat protein
MLIFKNKYHPYRCVTSCLFLFVTGFLLIASSQFSFAVSVVDYQSHDFQGSDLLDLYQPQAISSDPVDANLFLAEHRLMQGKWQEAAGYAHAALAKEKENSKGHAILGLISALGGYHQQAEEHLSYIGGKHETELYAELIAAVLNGQQKNYAQAREHLTAALQKDPTHPIVLYYSGSLYLAQDKLDQAEQAFLAALDHAPDLAPAHAGLGQNYWLKKQMEKAVGSYQKAVDAEPDTLLYHQQLIAIHQSVGQKEAAEKASRNMLYHVPGVKERFLDQGLDLINRGFYDEAIELADRLLAVYKNFPPGHYFKAVALVNKGKEEDARKSIADLIATGARVVKTHHEAGLCYLLLGDLDKAEEQFKLALGLSPDNSRSFVFLVTLEQLRGNRDLALDGLSVMLAQNEPPVLIHYLQANIHLADGRIEAYAQHMEQGKGLVPGLQQTDFDFDVRAKNLGTLGEQRNLMVLLYFNGRYEQSIKRSDAVLQTIPSDPFALWYHGLAKMAQKKYSEALSSFSQLLQLEPNLVAAQMELGRAYALTGDRNNALAKFAKVVELSPSYVPAYSAMGNLYFQSGEDEAAVQSYRKAIEIHPQTAQNYPPLAIILAEQAEQIDEALKYAEKAMELAPQDPASIDALGWVNIQQGQYRIGIENVQKSIRLFPQNPLFKYHLGYAYYKVNKPEQAQQLLQAALESTKDFRGSEQAQKILEELSQR